MYQAYHVTEATTFYQGDNLWTLPANLQGQDQVLPGEAYYVQMRLPDADSTEYLLMQPMVPAKRPNMIAWIAARNDGAARGQVLVYQLPADTSIFGPAQIEARIDQTPEISAQVTLWDQSGSQVVRGNLIVVPVGGSFVYLEPIYLQSTSSAFPQFTKIVVATPEKVVWANNLADALQLAVGTRRRPRSDTRPEPAQRHPAADAGTGQRRAADRHQRAHRLRQRPLQARPDGHRSRRLRDLRPRDVAGAVGPRPAGRVDRWHFHAAAGTASALAGRVGTVADRGQKATCVRCPGRAGPGVEAGTGPPGVGGVRVRPRRAFRSGFRDSHQAAASSVRAPIMYSTISWVFVSGVGRSATFRPRCMMMTRSVTANTSGRVCEMRMTGTP